MRIYEYESKELNIAGFGASRDKARMLERIARQEGMKVEELKETDIKVAPRNKLDS